MASTCFHLPTVRAYAGQAVDVTRRYAQHRRIYDDIVRMTFKEVRSDLLNPEERAVIWKLEGAGIKLRNVVFASIPYGPSDFDQVMPSEDRNRWLTDTGYTDMALPRTEDPETRRRFARKYQKFVQHSDAEDAVRILTTYVRQGIPAFPRSEMSFWACSCLPGYHRPDVEIYSRINVYQQEVFTVYSENRRLCFSWHLAKSPLEHAFGPSLSRMRQMLPSVELDDHTYEPGGQDQVSLWTQGADVALRLLSDPAVIRAIRLFNLRLMQKGPCMFSRYHCFDLADRFYDNSGERNTGMGDQEVRLASEGALTSESRSLSADQPLKNQTSVLARVRSLLSWH